MSSGTAYAINDFSIYLMPKLAAPECPPCQSDSLPSSFGGDEDDVKIVHQEMGSCRGEIEQRVSD
ncbi:hypothetical protein PSTG_05545 [Puccinia striiformis f. sp. tritici PST-78]|uniref:Uncharacterized protein n=1 Tax=Puccinia striiformis f. sp. tritici PST-78 TaxID=1165861 RepID=A0A0L0VQA5_9BASI|nr:hypothetical protein PSTG_05545 [Puccinia striiformis f. sp. tritici PST-78]